MKKLLIIASITTLTASCKKTNDVQLPIKKVFIKVIVTGNDGSEIDSKTSSI